MKEGSKIIFKHGSSPRDDEGSELLIGDNIVYASGSKSWVKVHLGKINRHTDSFIFFIDRNGTEHKVAGNSRRILKIDENSFR